MKAAIIFFISIMALTFVCSPLAAQSSRAGSRATAKRQATPRPLPVPASPSAAGSIVGSTYRNSYFGLQLTFPRGWVVQGDEAKERMKEMGKSMAVTKSQSEKAATDAAVERSANLLTVSKLPLGTAGQFNALLTCVAEPLPLAMPRAMYMARLKESLLNMTVPVTVEEEGGSETINGVQFSTLTIMMNPPASLPAQQKYYITIRKGYALGFVSTIFSESDAEAMNGIMKSIRFQ
jgi:hypothetical protein